MNILNISCKITIKLQFIAIKLQTGLLTGIKKPLIIESEAVKWNYENIILLSHYLYSHKHVQGMYFVLRK